jgi:hypothetical protein
MRRPCTSHGCGVAETGGGGGVYSDAPFVLGSKALTAGRGIYLNIFAQLERALESLQAYASCRQNRAITMAYRPAAFVYR